MVMEGELTTALHSLTLQPDMDTIRLHSVRLLNTFGFRAIQMLSSAYFISG